MGSDKLSSNLEGGEMGEKRVQKIYLSDHLSSKPDSFVVDMDNISHVMEKDNNPNSRFTRNLSRKGLARNGDMKITGNERDTPNMLTTSPRAATLHGASMPEKPASVVAVGSTDHSNHHQITITSASSTNGVATATEAKCIPVKRLSFRRTHPTWTDPRRILIFFATLSIMGTVLLIYFTLSIGKLNGNTNASI